MNTDDKFGIADRLRDSAGLIRDQIGGEEGDAVYLDLELMADEIEEMENSFDEKGEESFLTFTERDTNASVRESDIARHNMQHKLLQSTLGKNRQQGNKT